MNNVMLVLDNLGELIDQAQSATSVTERAAVFAAARVLTQDLDAAYPDRRGELILKVRQGIAALTGFDVTNDFESSDLARLTRSDLGELRRSLREP